MSVGRQLRNAVRARARNCCEHCRLPADLIEAIGFHIEHIQSRQHGGKTSLENLAFSCAPCNWNKGPNLCGVDAETGALARLFNPRTDEWSRHFEWDGLELVGETDVGRATISVLRLNAALRLAARAQLQVEGLFPYP